MIKPYTTLPDNKTSGFHFNLNVYYFKDNFIYIFNNIIVLEFPLPMELSLTSSCTEFKFKLGSTCTVLRHFKRRHTGYVRNFGHFLQFF